MRYPLKIVDEFGTPFAIVKNEDALVDYMDRIDYGDVYEVPHRDREDVLVVFEGMHGAWEYNPVGFARLHSHVLSEWPELLETCPKCGAYGEPSGRSRKSLVCPECGTRFDPIDMNALFKGRVIRRA